MLAEAVAGADSEFGGFSVSMASSGTLGGFSTIVADLMKKIPWMLIRTLTFTLLASPVSVGFTSLTEKVPMSGVG